MLALKSLKALFLLPYGLPAGFVLGIGRNEAFKPIKVMSKVTILTQYSHNAVTTLSQCSQNFLTSFISLIDLEKEHLGSLRRADTVLKLLLGFIVCYQTVISVFLISDRKGTPKNK